MKKLSEGYIFSNLLNGRSTEILDSLRLPIRTIDIVDLENIDDEFRNISKRFNTSLKEKILSKMLSGEIVLIHNPEYYKNIPFTIPSWTAQYKDKIVAVSNLSKVCAGTAIKPNIQERELFAAMHYAYVTHEFALNRGKYLNNADFKKVSTTIYVELFAKILDKLYSLKASPINVVTAKYNIAKFFLLNHIGSDNNKILEDYCYAIATKHHHTSINVIQDASSNIEDKDFENIFTFCTALSGLPGLNRMDFKLFLQEYLVLFGETMLLGLENLPIFTSNILTAVISSRYVRAAVIETTVTPQAMASLYAAFSR